MRLECGLAPPAARTSVALTSDRRRSLALEQLYRLVQSEIASSSTRGVIWFITRGEDPPRRLPTAAGIALAVRLSRSS